MNKLELVECLRGNILMLFEDPGTPIESEGMHATVRLPQLVSDFAKVIGRISYFRHELRAAEPDRVRF